MSVTTTCGISNGNLSNVVIELEPTVYDIYIDCSFCTFI